MYYLTRAIKRRFIYELQDAFGKHPFFKKIVPYIQDKFAYQERPQYGIVVKNTSANKVQLSADNYIGTVISYCQKALIDGKDGLSVEWVREDTRAINTNGGTFPSVPGIYYLDFTSDTQFMVDPLLDVIREYLVEFDGSVSSINYMVTVSKGVIQLSTLFVYTDTDAMLIEGTHYTVNYTTGQITFKTDLNGYRLYADYKYAVTSTGPYTVGLNTYNNTAIPGVIMAFGRAAHVGDGCAIIVTPKRTINALEYGGKWEINLSFDVLAKDPIQMEEIADLVLIYLWGERKEKLEYEGIVIQDISHGGEADEVYDETGQEMYHNVSMDLTVSADWNIHVPVPFRIAAFEFVDDLLAYRKATDTEVLTITNTLQVVPSLTPYMPKLGLTHNYERIA